MTVQPPVSPPQPPAPSTQPVPYDRAFAHRLLADMLRIRRMEEKSAELYGAGRIRGFLHLYIGEEAVAVGALHALQPQDNLVATYREHAHALLRGMAFSLQQVAMKALPVVILGGLTSVPGAILGGLIIGVGEKLSEVYIGPLLGGGIEIWFAYVLALLFLLVRPQGLFGEKIIDRV